MVDTYLSEELRDRLLSGLQKAQSVCHLLFHCCTLGTIGKRRNRGKNWLADAGKETRGERCRGIRIRGHGCSRLVARRSGEVTVRVGVCAIIWRCGKRRRCCISVNRIGSIEPNWGAAIAGACCRRERESIGGTNGKAARSGELGRT
jgi:hypothetical protein